VSALVVVTTVGTEEEANRLARELVARRHSCCVNILPIQRSVYRWQGEICEDSEFMRVVEPLEEEYEKVEAAIQGLHSFELPEILAFNVRRGEEGFLHWITACLSKEAEPQDDGAEGKESSTTS